MPSTQPTMVPSTIASLREPPIIHVIIPLYNGESFIRDCLESIQRQKDCHFTATIVDDCSQDSSADLAAAVCGNDSRFRLIRSHLNGGPLQTLIRGIQSLKARRDDVIACIDCDDQLVGSDSLSLVADAYAQTDCWLTYGSMTSSQGERRGRAYERRTIRDNLFRAAPWLASHLKTFRKDLWSCVKDVDLRDDNGDYFRVATDLAIMIPMLEMAGHRQCFIPDAIYYYRTMHSSSISATQSDRQHLMGQRLRSRPRYSPLLGPGRTTASSTLE